jgi:GTP-binding protein
MLSQTGAFRENQAVAVRVMDSNELERERGITILAKNTAVFYKGTKINIVDTPGHADFGGEVERTLTMVDGVLLLVDAAEGPLPGTRFVLRKALDLKLKPIVVINKTDRKDARAYEVLDEVFELFMSLGADDEQLDFPTLFTIATLGVAKRDLKDEGTTLEPLFETILDTVPAPTGDADEPFQMLITTIDHNDYVGRLGIGRIARGTIRLGSPMKVVHHDGVPEDARVTKIYTFEGLKRVEVNEASAGDVIAIAGMEDVAIGETLADAADPTPLSFVSIEEPTMSMDFLVNTSPFAGQEGRYITTRNLAARLERELRSNVSLRVEPTETADCFRVSGRGELHLAILIETMRREGYEFQVSRPEVILRRIDDVLSEPIEDVVVEVPEEHVGAVIENLGKRKGEMINMTTGTDGTRIEFRVPSRGLFGFRNELLTQTKGTAIMHQNLYGYEPYKGEFTERTRGALVAMEAGTAIPYSIFRLQDRGTFFIAPGTKVYAGMVVGENKRNQDMPINVCKTKQLTNVRAVGSDDTVHLEPPRLMSLDQSLEWLSTDEYLEVTPASIRIRKRDIGAGKIRPSKATQTAQV